MKNKTWLQKVADERGIPPRSLGQVKTALAKAKKQGVEKDLARLMLKFGRLTADARSHVELITEFPPCEMLAKRPE